MKLWRDTGNCCTEHYVGAYLAKESHNGEILGEIKNNEEVVTSGNIIVLTYSGDNIT